MIFGAPTSAGRSSSVCAPTDGRSPRVARSDGHARDRRIRQERWRMARRRRRSRQRRASALARAAEAPRRAWTSFSTPRRPTAARAAALGGGPLADAAPDAFDAWRPRRRAPPSPPVGGEPLRAGSGAARPPSSRSPADRRAARCPAAGCGPPAPSACARSRSAAALELREHGIHVALLIVDAGIEPSRAAGARASSGGAGRPARDRRRRRLPGRAGRARRDPRAAGHAAGRAWVP